MRLLVTGREGQLAQSLARLAPDAGIDLVHAARPEVDLAEPGALAAVIRAARPDLVVNAAAYTAVDKAESEPDLAQRINGDAAGEAAAAAADLGIPVIQISTDYVLDGKADRPIAEDHAVAPINAYGQTKHSGEEQVRAANPRHLIVRTAWVISPFGHNFVRSILNGARARPELTVVADQVGSPTSAIDLAAGLLRAAPLLVEGHAGLAGQTLHLAGSGEASWFDLAQAVMDEARANGLPAVPVRPIATTDWPTPARRPAYSVLDSRRFTAATGFAMPDWRTSLSAIVAELADTQG